MAPQGYKYVCTAFLRLLGSVPEHTADYTVYSCAMFCDGFPQAFFGVGTKENEKFLVIHLEIILSEKNSFFMPAVFY